MISKRNTSTACSGQAINEKEIQMVKMSIRKAGTIRLTSSCYYCCARVA
jgi:hypothetical protein